MWYVICGIDGENSLEKRIEARPRHLQRLHELRDQGRLLLAGPHPAIDSEDPGPAGFSGSLIIAEFNNMDEAKTWAQADPYVESGVYERVDIKPFLKVLP